MNGWIGVDLDGTLAQYDGFKGADHIGEPVEPMLARVKEWLADGKDVRIFTARVNEVTQNGEDAELAAYHVRQWCIKHIGQELEITSEKDFGMVELWDDRCVQVTPNTGEPVAGAAPRSDEPEREDTPDLEDGMTVEARMEMATRFVTAALEAGWIDDFDETAADAVAMADAVLRLSGWYRVRRKGIEIQKDQKTKAETGLVVPGGGRRRH